MRLSKGEKKYLLGVALTQNEYGWTRLKWIAEFFGVKMSTVKEFLDSLEGKKLIEHQRRGSIKLTEEGKKVVEEDYQRLRTVETFFRDCLVIDEDTAKKSALKILFDLDDVVADRLYKFIDFMTKCPTKPVFIDKFEKYVREGKVTVCEFCPVLMERGDEGDSSGSQNTGEEDNVGR